LAVLTSLAGLGALMWVLVLCLPWRPHRSDESLEPAGGGPVRLQTGSAGGLSVIMPARNEAQVLGRTLPPLLASDVIHEVLLVDDHSTDDTRAVAESFSSPRLHILSAPELPAGWSGKLWALESARREASGEWLLLVDADIELAPGMVDALLQRQQETGAALVSLMAWLRMESHWERLLMPAFVFFFKLLYPFRLANGPRPAFAAAAGGCVLVRASTLQAIGGFGAIRGALIDDCSLAAAVKRSGERTWIGLTHGARSLREYPQLADVWRMVSRTAYTQLRHSPLLLLLCVFLMTASLLAPTLALLFDHGVGKAAGLIGLLAMALAYHPTLLFYGLPAWRALTLPLAGGLFLAMTVGSALEHHRGTTAVWRDRSYPSA
jgi:hopene-associated glycosyltransferase HpnB